MSMTRKVAQAHVFRAVSRLHTCRRAFSQASGALLKDEYGRMDASGEDFFIDDFKTELGFTFPSLRVKYKTWGTLNEKGDNAMIICHALTGNADVASWWGGMLGDGYPFDTSKYFIVCANLLGSCYGSTGPNDVNPLTGYTFRGNFPVCTVRDNVRAQHALYRHLGINEVACAIGGSLGGMQVLEHCIMGREFVQSGIAMVTGGFQHAWNIGISEGQRQAIYADPNFNNGDWAVHPDRGLAVARQTAMITYRTHSAYATKFGRERRNGYFEVENYLHAQGKKIKERGFDAGAYLALTRTMDTHDVARGRGDYFDVLRSIEQPMLLVGIDSDNLHPPSEQTELADYIPDSQLMVVHSSEGHDGFLLEQKIIGRAIMGFLSLQNTDFGRVKGGNNMTGTLS